MFAEIGAVCFGLVVGWITYRTLRRKESVTALSDISTVIGAVGGAAVTGLFKDAELFGLYCIGLAVGFFLYLIVLMAVTGKAEAGKWMGEP
jgi:zinc transporter ZupT